MYIDHIEKTATNVSRKYGSNYADALKYQHEKYQQTGEIGTAAILMCRKDKDQEQSGDCHSY